jgi:YaiO family outer membrane protein
LIINKKILFSIFLCFSVFITVAQDTTSSDGLFQLARKAAFDEKNYTKAKDYLYRALAISPNYADIRIFLGRIYTWTDQYDSAKSCFTYVVNIKPDYEEVALAYTDLEYWNNHYTNALLICNNGLQYHPQSEDLLIRKAKILRVQKNYNQADSTIQIILKLNKNNSEARALADKIKEESAKRRMSVSYDYVYFDKQFANPWHLVSVDYGQSTKIGTVIGRINYANRFAENGVQFEADAYPKISKTFYSYVNLGYSDNVGVFPQWRGGFSLYANLPKSFEGELGFRYLQFTGTPTWIYIASLGKYYKSWLLGAKVYIVPSDYTSTVSASYNLSARYYYSGNADNVCGITAGYGISPDDRAVAIQLGTINNQLPTYKLGAFYKKKVSRMNVLSIDATWYNQEYLPQTIGNQYQIGISWLFRF